MRNQRKILGIGLGLLFVLVIEGCRLLNNDLETSFPQEIGDVQISPTPIANATNESDSLDSQGSTITPRPSSSPTLQPTQTVTPSPRLTEFLSPTPWATIPTTEAENRILVLLANNQDPDCLLPCWWGAVPGQTKWRDIEPFLNSFANKIRTTPRGASVTLPLPEPITVPGFDFNIVYVWNEFGIINGIDVDSVNVSGYDAKTVVTLYGIPDEVWLTTLDEPREGVLPFQLIVVYQKKGFSLHYTVNATQSLDTITACFEPDFIETERPDLFPVSPRMYLWEPGQTKTIQEIAPIPLERYFPLEEKTALTPQTLYERFSDSTQAPCVSTSSALWEQ